MSISSRCVKKPMDCPLSTGLSVLIWSASTFSSASLSWSKRSTDTGTQLENRSPRTYIGAFAVKQDTFVDFLSNRTGWLLTLNRSLRSYNSIFGLWLGLLGVFTTSSNFWTQFFHPIVFKGNSRWRTNFLVDVFSSFHLYSLRDTISWECVVKDDCVRSCLIEL